MGQGCRGLCAGAEAVAPDARRLGSRVGALSRAAFPVALTGWQGLDPGLQHGVGEASSDAPRERGVPSGRFLRRGFFAVFVSAMGPPG